MSHRITVSFSAGRVSADPNPSPGLGSRVMPGETVTWSFDETRELQVVFNQIVDLDEEGRVIEATRRAVNPMGPLNALSLGRGLIVGTIRSDVPQGATNRRFLYRLIEDGAALPWTDRVEGGDETNGGGIDIPRTPP